jgi:NTE family protein
MGPDRVPGGTWTRIGSLRALRRLAGSRPAEGQQTQDQQTQDQQAERRPAGTVTARHERIGLVLGAGGVVGAAWMTGAVQAVQERLPVPAGEVDLIVGTSAGSVLAAALRCGVSLEDMVALQRGEAVPELRQAGVRDLDDGPLPPRPQLRAGSPRLMLASVLTPHRVHPGVGASAWLPRGRARHEALRATVEALGHRRGRDGADPSPEAWADGRTWIVAVDYDTGHRAMFGREGAPRASLPDAVVASCSIPGWYAPVVIGDHQYVDGGVRSATSLGALARSGLDHVYVLAPMASIVADRPARPPERLERRLRRLLTRSLLREAELLRAQGTQVTLLTPGPEDLAAMGVNLMDPRRRAATLETSLRTVAATLAWPAGSRHQVA